MCPNRTTELSCSCPTSCILLLQESCPSLLTRGFIVMHTMPIPMWSALFRTCWTPCPGMYWIIPHTTHNLHFVACVCVVLLKKVLKPQRLSLDKDSGVVAHWLWQQQSREYSVESSVFWRISGFPVRTPVETTVNGLYSFIQNNTQIGFIWTSLKIKLKWCVFQWGV